MKQAVCVLIPLHDGHYVAVSRKGDATKWGIPGGKVDPGESNVEAAVRELYEETTIRVSPASLIPIYSGACSGEVTYWVTTYLYRGDPEKYLEELADHMVLCEGFSVEFGTEMACSHVLELCDPYISPFAAYNAEVFAALSRMNS